MTPRVAFTILLLLHVHVVCDIKTKAKNKASGNIFFTLFRAAIRLRANMLIGRKINMPILLMAG